MATREAFEVAAAEFEAMVDQAGLVTVAAKQAPVREIMRGGTLGDQLDQAIDRADTLIDQTVVKLRQVARLCMDRASFIAEYEQQLERYLADLDRYWADYDSWYDDYINWYWYPEDNSDPGPAPVAPTALDPPPDWADIGGDEP